MGFASRSVSIFRYRVRGEIEGSFWDAVHEGVKRHAFHSLGSGGDELAAGWTSLHDFTDYEFSGGSYLFGSLVALALRIDTVRVPPKILEMHLKIEARKMLEETGQRRLSSVQVRSLKERLNETLRKQALPSIQVFELIWDTAKAVAYFGSHSVKARERVEDHFKKSFGLTLVPLIPYILGQEMMASGAESALLEKLKASSMVP